MNSEFLCPVTAAAADKTIALRIENREISYFELDCLISGLCFSLRKKGIAKDDKVAFIAHLDWRVMLLFFALFRLHAIACPLSTRLPDKKVKESLAALNADHFLDISSLVFEEKSSPESLLKEEQLATFLFTSGSTAAPKIACHTLGNHLYNALGVNEALKLSSQHRWLLSLPLYHIGGIAILFRCFLAKATIVFPPASYDTITHLSFVPTQLYRLKDSIQATILVGGAPLPPSLYKKNLKLVPTYGLTEMSSVVSLESHPSLSDREISLGSDNEVLLRGKTLFQGYYSKEGKIHLPLNEKGWFATRDLGMWSPEGALRIIGRKDNLFISGGENIQPEEIELALLSLPNIVQAIVVPIHDPEFGARPVAFIHDESGSYTLETVRTALEQVLPRFKLPIKLFSLPEEYRISKPSRQKLRDLIKNI